MCIIAKADVSPPRIANLSRQYCPLCCHCLLCCRCGRASSRNHPRGSIGSRRGACPAGGSPSVGENRERAYCDLQENGVVWIEGNNCELGRMETPPTDRLLHHPCWSRCACSGGGWNFSLLAVAGMVRQLHVWRRAISPTRSNETDP